MRLPLVFDFKFKSSATTVVPFKASEDTILNLLPPVPDAIVNVGTVEQFLADIPIVDELPSNPTVGQLVIYTGEE